MQRVEDDNRFVSVRLSRVLDDIGVNRDMVLLRRRTWLLIETLKTIGFRFSGRDVNVFVFGSQTEGTTSPQLGSDLDMLSCMNMFSMIQDLDEWQMGKFNFLILRDQTTGPGYCHLQRLRSDVPQPLTEVPTDEGPADYTKDDSGRILYNNTVVGEASRLRYPTSHIEGPAICRDGSVGFGDLDTIAAYPCKSWPYEARPWLVRRRGHWPPQSLIRLAEKSGCFIVAKGQKMSPFKNLEWRISTSLAERMLMFSMNITQLQCYYSLKAIIKTLITKPIGKCVSSYHCKTVVFYSIESSSPQLWREECLFDCIRYCLQQLHSYLSKGHLPNYFIPEDNMIAERISPSQVSKIIEILDGVLSEHGQFLLSISIDSIGQRLLNSFNILPAVHVEPSHKLCTRICDELAINLYSNITGRINKILSHKNALGIVELRIAMNSVISLARRGTYFQRLAARSLLPCLCSSLGSMIAASDMSQGRNLSPAVKALFRYGIDSDAASSKLKFATIMYRRGEFMKAARLLQDLENTCDRSDVLPVCDCYSLATCGPPGERFSKYSYDAARKSFRQNVSYCVRFLPLEKQCVPRDLQLEMFRSCGNGEQYKREKGDSWMDWAVIDSLPFLHYLQYLVSRQLESHDLQMLALHHLNTDTEEEDNLGHKETALNLFGKCSEQENDIIAAKMCYKASLSIRPRHNAANNHMACLEYKRSHPTTARPESTCCSCLLV